MSARHVAAAGLGAAIALAPLAALTAAPASAAAVDAGGPAKDGGPLVLAQDGGSDRISRTPPDPTPLFEARQWVYDLKWDKGEPYLVGVGKLDLDAGRATPRAMGRFALELFEGPTLIERVRFDFPLLLDGDLPPDAGMSRRDRDEARMKPRFDRKLITRIGVVFPATRRGNRLELVDRATGRRWDLPWAPK